ncbi:MAG: SRPBCC domain-containing protein [Bacteroidia bacterium]|nr:SRPBCC domain-containing protein [Bacteroidia bacterium]
MKTFPDFTKSISVNASAEKVWQAISSADLVKQWMLDEGLEVEAGKMPGEPFTVTGKLHWVPFKNKGYVLHADEFRRFSYSHLSSLSALQDLPENYTIVDFEITPQTDTTLLKLRLSNFPTESIYKHVVFYWNTTLGVLKTFIEKS